MLRLRTLGGLSLEGFDGTAPGIARDPRCLALLARLAVAADAGLPRADAAALLGPPPAAGPDALDALVRTLRSELHQDLFLPGYSGLRLSPSALQADVTELHLALERRDITEAENLYLGPFLDGFHLLDAPAFEAWAVRERERLDEQFRSVVSGEHYTEDPVIRTPRSTAPRVPQAPAIPVRATARALGSVVAGRYVLERELGRGGMAVVFFARDIKHDRDVALKFLRAVVPDDAGLQRFQQEIAVLARLQHPHILPLYDSGEEGGALFYVMPFVGGETLRERLTRERQLPTEDALRIGHEVADALAYAHGHGVVHRDIKPENIILANGHAMVLDFGIARAVRQAAPERLTTEGYAVGTPAYMSPEQALGDTLDERSDLYSLACVLYEMLTGAPPYPGDSGPALLVRRITAPPAPIRKARPSVPAAVDHAIARALSRLPADRQRSVAEFSREIGDTSAERPVAGPARAALQLWPWAGVAAVAAAVGLTLLALRPAPVDQDLLVVLPFAHRPATAAPALSGNNCEQLLYEALQRWNGIRLVDNLRVSDAVGRRARTSLGVSDVLGIARGLRAGRAAWGEVYQLGSALRVRGVVYDVRSGSLLREFSVPVRADLSDAARSFTELADSLVVPLAAPQAPARSAPIAMGGTHSVAALRSYLAGRDALSRWRLDSARQLFAEAAQDDPDYALAHLWLAQATILGGTNGAGDWRASAARAVSLSAQLTPYDSLLARATLSLAASRYPEACDEYATLVRRDSMDFKAWFGLGECRSRDHLVVRDAASPSGWRFRSSQNAAIDAYAAALRIVPSFQSAFSGAAFARLSTLLFTESNRVLRGYALDPDTVWLLAFPALDHDTLLFVPYHPYDLAAGRFGSKPPSRAAAVAHDRELLRQVSARWVSEFPSDADAHEALARVLEEQGEIAVGRDANGSALDQIQLARRFARDDAEALRFAAARLRLLVKLSRFAAARALADSLLASHPDPTPREAKELVGPAELTGRILRAAELSRRSAPADVLNTLTGDVVAPLEPMATGLALEAFAASGAYDDSVRALTHQVDTLLERWAPAEQRPMLSEMLRDWSAVLAFPRVGASNVHRARADGDPQLEMQWALSRGDTAGVRLRFDTAMMRRRFDSPGRTDIDVAFQEAWLRLALRDSTAAVTQLDASLGALPTLGTSLVHDVAQAGALPRAMFLRAELAQRQGNRMLARRWAESALALWQDADPALRESVARLRVLASP